MGGVFYEENDEKNDGMLPGGIHLLDGFSNAGQEKTPGRIDPLSCGSPL